jgi:hypothetical protein
MCGPHFCSIRITEDVRRYAAEQCLAEDDAVQRGMGRESCGVRQNWRGLSKSVMRMSMNTRLSGSARVDSTHVLPQGGVRGQTNSVKITEDVRRYAAQEKIDEASVIDHGLQAKAREFQQAGAEVYSKP